MNFVKHFVNKKLLSSYLLSSKFSKKKNKYTNKQNFVKKTTNLGVTHWPSGTKVINSVLVLLDAAHIAFNDQKNIS